MRWMFLFGPLVAGVASAADIELVHQTRILDAAGGPLNGPHDVTVILSTQATPTDPEVVLWTRTYPGTVLEDGYATFTLGLSDAGTPIDSAWMSDPMFVTVQVDGQVLGPRQPLVQVPSAGFADTAGHAQSATTAQTATSAGAADTATTAQTADVALAIPTQAGTGGGCTTAGAVAYDTTADSLAVCDGTGWRTQALPASYRHLVHVQSRGLDSTAGSSRIEIDGGLIQQTGRSYGLVAIDLATGQVVHTRTYDVYGNANAAAALATDLDGFGPNHLVIVNTYDEPQRNRTTNGLPAAMYRCGASAAVFGGTFTYRSAYLLVGRCGYGQGSGVELYSGDVDRDTTASVEYAFEIRDGVWLR